MLKLKLIFVQIFVSCDKIKNRMEDIQYDIILIDLKIKLQT